MGVVVRGKRGHVRPDSRHVLRGQDTRRRILGAARARILVHGFEALHLDDLAADVGVTKAAIVKSAGGKASILLALGEQDIESRHAILRRAVGQRGDFRRRLHGLARRLYALDLPRLRLLQAYIGYLWFWADADHDRVQGHIDASLDLLCGVVRSALGDEAPPARVRAIALRLMAGYVIGLRDLYYGRSDIAEASRLVVDFALG